MAADEHLERAIQALLDGSASRRRRRLRQWRRGPEPLCVVDAIARAHRTAIFGTDIAAGSPRRLALGPLWRSAAESAVGASGTVYRAWDPKLAREVALSCLAPDALRYRPTHSQRSQLLARLNHPHRPRVRRRRARSGERRFGWSCSTERRSTKYWRAMACSARRRRCSSRLTSAGALSAVHAAGLLPHRDV